MSDWMLLYLFTRLDALGGVVWVVTIFAAGATIAMVGWTLSCAHANPEKWSSPNLKREAERDRELLPVASRWAKRAGAALCFALLLTVALPTKKDMAIIVGGKIALDVGRSDTAKEVGQEVLDAIRAQLKKAAQ